MNHHSEPTDASAPATGGPAPAPSLDTRALDRRRLLLKGVGRGSALLGATVPLKTLAGQRIITFDATQCTVSGMQSGIHSASPGTPVCSGFVTSSWGQSVNNQGVVTPAKRWPVAYATQCKTIFRRCTLLDNKTRLPASLFAVVSQYPTSEDAHWVCAWLNSFNPASMNFPYTTKQVLDYYNASNSNALGFFRKYTETKA